MLSKYAIGKVDLRSVMLALAFILYIMLTADAILQHSPWRDEAYVWLIGRELSWADIYRETGSNGAPSLWYYAVAILAKAGFSYESMQAMHWIGACISAALVLFFSPFTPLLRVLFVLSYYVVYLHAVVARDYMPTMLFLWLTCIYYPRRASHPFRYCISAGLLANTTLFGLMASCYFLADIFFLNEFWIRSRFRPVVAFALQTLLMGASFISLIPPRDALPYYVQAVPLFHPGNLFRFFQFVSLPPFSERILGVPSSIDQWIIIFSPIFTILLFASAATWLWQNRAYLLLCFLATSWLFIMYLAVFRYPWAAERHFSFALFYVWMCAWLVPYDEGNPLSSKIARSAFNSLSILLAFSFLLSSNAIVFALSYEGGFRYSASYPMARYMLSHDLGNVTVITNEPDFTSSVLPYLPKVAMWNAETGAYMRYNHDDRNSRQHLSPAETMARAQKSGVIQSSCPSEQSCYGYFLSMAKIKDSKKLRLRKVFYAHGIYESFYLYRLSPKH